MESRNDRLQGSNLQNELNSIAQQLSQWEREYTSRSSPLDTETWDISGEFQSPEAGQQLVSDLTNIQKRLENLHRQVLNEGIENLTSREDQREIVDELSSLTQHVAYYEKIADQVDKSYIPTSPLSISQSSDSFPHTGGVSTPTVEQRLQYQLDITKQLQRQLQNYLALADQANSTVLSQLRPKFTSEDLDGEEDMSLSESQNSPVVIQPYPVPYIIPTNNRSNMAAEFQQLQRFQEIQQQQLHQIQLMQHMSRMQNQLQDVLKMQQALALSPILDEPFTIPTVAERGTQTPNATSIQIQTYTNFSEIKSTLKSNSGSNTESFAYERETQTPLADHRRTFNTKNNDSQTYSQGDQETQTPRPVQWPVRQMDTQTLTTIDGDTQTQSRSIYEEKRTQTFTQSRHNESRDTQTPKYPINTDQFGTQTPLPVMVLGEKETQTSQFNRNESGSQTIHNHTCYVDRNTQTPRKESYMRESDTQTFTRTEISERETQTRAYVVPAHTQTIEPAQAKQKDLEIQYHDLAPNNKTTAHTTTTSTSPRAEAIEPHEPNVLSIQHPPQKPKAESATTSTQHGSPEHYERKEPKPIELHITNLYSDGETSFSSHEVQTDLTADAIILGADESKSRWDMRQEEIQDRYLVLEMVDRQYVEMMENSKRNEINSIITNQVKNFWDHRKNILDREQYRGRKDFEINEMDEWGILSRLFTQQRTIAIEAQLTRERDERNRFITDEQVGRDSVGEQEHEERYNFVSEWNLIVEARKRKRAAMAPIYFQYPFIECNSSQHITITRCPVYSGAGQGRREVIETKIGPYDGVLGKSGDIAEEALNSKKQHAAIVIQKNVRGRQTRQKTKRKKKDRTETRIRNNEEEEKLYALIQIQSLMRKLIVKVRTNRIKNNRKRNGALTIQCSWRQYQSRQIVETKRRELRRAEKNLAYEIAATKIQAWVRQILSNMKSEGVVVRRGRAASTIQTHYKGYKQRKDYQRYIYRRQSEDRMRVMNEAATSIQSAFRGYTVRRKPVYTNLNYYDPVDPGIESDDNINIIPSETILEERHQLSKKDSIPKIAPQPMIHPKPDHIPNREIPSHTPVPTHDIALQTSQEQHTLFTPASLADLSVLEEAEAIEEECRRRLKDKRILIVAATRRAQKLRHTALRQGSNDERMANQRRRRQQKDHRLKQEQIERDMIRESVEERLDLWREHQQRQLDEERLKQTLEKQKEQRKAILNDREVITNRVQSASQRVRERRQTELHRRSVHQLVSEESQTRRDLTRAWESRLRALWSECQDQFWSGVSTVVQSWSRAFLSRKTTSAYNAISSVIKVQSAMRSVLSTKITTHHWLQRAIKHQKMLQAHAVSAQQHVMALELIAREHIEGDEYTAFMDIRQQWQVSGIGKPALEVQRLIRGHQARAKAKQLKQDLLLEEEREVNNRMMKLKIKSLMRQEEVQRRDIIREQRDTFKDRLLRPQELLNWNFYNSLRGDGEDISPNLTQKADSPHWKPPTKPTNKFGAWLENTLITEKLMADESLSRFDIEDFEKQRYQKLMSEFYDLISQCFSRYSALDYARSIRTPALSTPQTRSDFRSMSSKGGGGSRSWTPTDIASPTSEESFSRDYTRNSFFNETPERTTSAHQFNVIQARDRAALNQNQFRDISSSLQALQNLAHKHFVDAISHQQHQLVESAWNLSGLQLKHPLQRIPAAAGRGNNWMEFGSNLLAADGKDPVTPSVNGSYANFNPPAQQAIAHNNLFMDWAYSVRPSSQT